MNQSQTSLVNPSNRIPYILHLVGWKDLLMMSGFGSYYLNLVSITFYIVPTSFSFFSEKKFENSMLNYYSRVSYQDRLFVYDV